MRVRLSVAARTLLAGLAVVTVLTGRVESSLATFGDVGNLAGNEFTTGSWQHLYLHNRPTPPTGSTTAQRDLVMDGSPPTATTLHNYDIDADTAAGRQLRLSGSGPDEADLADYVNWRTNSFTASRAINGRARLEVWSTANALDLLKCGELIAYLRDYDPVADSYVDIASTSVSNLLWSGLDLGWVEYELTFSSVSYTVPAGHQLELKLITGSGSCRSLYVAYDTTDYDSRLTLP